jgi:hypothetical protein
MFNLIVDVLLILLIFSIFKNVDLFIKLRKVKKINQILESKIAEISVPKKTTYENDMSFLIHVINFKIENVVQYLLKPAQISISEIIKDDMFEEWKKQIVEEVLSTISKDYYKLLTTYFTEDGLYTFIVETVNFSLMQVILTENFKK